jgi:tungstate transport system substrate-binding protein
MENNYSFPTPNHELPGVGLIMRCLLFLVAMSLPLSGPVAAAAELRLGTTHTTLESGLLQTLLPAFEAASGAKVMLLVGGTGQVLKYGEQGDVDVVLVHSRPDEEKFVAAGFGVERKEVMASDFIVVGPANDPSRIRGLKHGSEAFKRIAITKATFVSRGDDSGTHKMERRLWEESAIHPSGEWYLSAGSGMADTLRIASERQAYALSERATFAAQRGKLDLDLLVAGDPKIANPYGVIAVNPKRFGDVDYRAARMFIEWITSSDAKRRIGAYRINGEQVFTPAP